MIEIDEGRRPLMVITFSDRITAIEPMPQPRVVFSTIDEAMVWVGERLRDIGADLLGV